LDSYRLYPKDFSAGRDSAARVEGTTGLVKSSEAVTEMSEDRHPGRVFRDYLGTRPGDTEPVRDAVVVRSDAAVPVILRQLRLGDVNVCLFAGEDVDVTPYRWRSANDGVVLGYVAAGAVRVGQDHRTVELGAGQVAMYDGVTPYRLRAEGRHRFLVAHIRARALSICPEDRDLLVARGLSAFAGATALAAILGAVDEAGLDPARGAGQHLGEAIVACVRAIVAEARGAGAGSRSTALFEILTAWLDTHLSDDILTPDLLAAHHFLSSRYVRKLFADHGTTVTAYVRLRRLERIRDELLQRSAAHLPVSAIGARWGYKDPSVFSRAFHRQFGQGPQSFRREAIDRVRHDG
jgi:AraC-like DNA-binding protein